MEEKISVYFRDEEVYPVFYLDKVNSYDNSTDTVITIPQSLYNEYETIMDQWNQLQKRLRFIAINNNVFPKGRSPLSLFGD